MDYLEYKLPTWALPAIINNDYTGCNDEERDIINSFLSELPPGHFSIVSEEYFTNYDLLTPFKKLGNAGMCADAHYFISRS